MVAAVKAVVIVSALPFSLPVYFVEVFYLLCCLLVALSLQCCGFSALDVGLDLCVPD